MPAMPWHLRRQDRAAYASRSKYRRQPLLQLSYAVYELRIVESHSQPHRDVAFGGIESQDRQAERMQSLPSGQVARLGTERTCKMVRKTKIGAVRRRSANARLCALAVARRCWTARLDRLAHGLGGCEARFRRRLAAALFGRNAHGHLLRGAIHWPALAETAARLRASRVRLYRRRAGARPRAGR